MFLRRLIKFAVFVLTCVVLTGLAGCAPFIVADRDTLTELGTKLEHTIREEADRIIDKAGDKYEDVLRRKEERERNDKRFDRAYTEHKDIRKEAREYAKELFTLNRQSIDDSRKYARDLFSLNREDLNRSKDEQYNKTIVIWVAIGSVTAILLLFTTLINLAYREKKGKQQ